MATILLQTAGAAFGSLFGPFGAIVGRAAGALAGAAVDRALIGGETRRGPRLEGGRIPSAEEGAGINRLYGTARIAGTLIWATRFEEAVTRERQGAKGGGQRVETYSYFGNFAIGLCEGVIAGIRRVWADGQELDLTAIEMRVHSGTEEQLPDPLIDAKQRDSEAPAYRGLAYVVFERLPLDRFGNRIPVLTFEVMRPIGRLEQGLRAITMIPGATEHGYQPASVSERVGDGEGRFLNRHALHATSDWAASLDELQALCPNLESVALVCAWFGSDLRAGACRIDPRVEVALRLDESQPWSVAGIGRQSALLVSRKDGSPAYGGTPSDASVRAAIADLKARGLKVYLYPFVMLDVPPGNGLPDPEGGAEQPAYPWRGRITSYPAPGRLGSADRTAVVRAQVEDFCGPALPMDFAAGAGGIVYSGSDSGYRRFILHYAHLAAQTGGVDGFILGSEMRGLTRLRDENDAFPFVDALIRLADDVRSIMGPATRLTYAADWTEYFGYRPDDGSGDVFFNLDPLWMSDAIDAIGIDNYMPLADWRDGDVTDGNPDGFTNPTDREGMRAQIAGGEGFDWYYATASDRAERRRTPITDGAHDKPWVFRTKDLEGWWSNPHFERRGGVERALPTTWLPGAKPIWFTELGCPAVDKGANQPNVFPDPKSSEGQIPYFSTGVRSELIQRRFMEAHLDHWSSSDVPAGMVDPAHIFGWTWDARPYPAFPADSAVWSDGANWRTGHWLNGRLGTAAMADIIEAIGIDHGVSSIRCDDLNVDLIGYVQSEPMTARALIEPLLELAQADANESAGVIRISSRSNSVVAPLAADVLVEPDEAATIAFVRSQTDELAVQCIIDHIDPDSDYSAAIGRSRRLETSETRLQRLSLPAVMTEETAGAQAEAWLRDHWAGGERATFALPPSRIEVEPGDVLLLEGQGTTRWAVTRIEDGGSRRIEARSIAQAQPKLPGTGGTRPPSLPDRLAPWLPMIELIDLPVLDGFDETGWFKTALWSRPFKRALLSMSEGEEGFRERAEIERPARMGVLTAALQPGVANRFDRSGTLFCRLAFGSLESAAELAVLNGANALAVRSNSGVWEVVQFTHAEETEIGHWRLSGLLRGQGGTEDAMRAGADIGARVVVLDEALAPIQLRPSEVGIPFNWRITATGGEVQPLETAMAGGTRALTPLAPVHLEAFRDQEGSIDIRWIRRGRIDSDSWLGSDIPLDADSERYRLQIIDASATQHVADVFEPRFHLSDAEQRAIFGAPLSTIEITVRQIGSRMALGLPARAVITL
jgi:hypothetical protein